MPTLTFTSPALQQYQETARKNAELRKEEILLCLRLVGAARVVIEYDGCGDSGQIESITVLDTQQREISAPENDKTMQALRDFAYDLLEARHPGWENNDGAYGEFIWDVAEDQLSHTHNDRFTDYNTTEHEGL